MLAMLAALMQHHGLTLHDPEVAALQEATQPEILAQQLNQTLAQEPGSPPLPVRTP